MNRAIYPRTVSGPRPSDSDRVYRNVEAISRTAAAGSMSGEVDFVISIRLAPLRARDQVAQARSSVLVSDVR